MKAETRLFGPIDIKEDKIIYFEQGIIGFPELKHFALIFDSEREEKSAIMWLQSMEDGDIAIPVMSPDPMLPDYHPMVNEALLKPLGGLTEENTYILVTVRVPEQIQDISVNLKAPIIINSDSNKGSQLIVEDDYEIRYRIYHLIQDGKKKAGE